MRVGIGFMLLLLFSVLLFMAFAKKVPKTQAELITEYINGELAKTRSAEWKKCYANTIKDAEHYVDSIIYQQVNFTIGDSLQAPGKPLKPSKPYDTLRLDTTPIVPILLKKN